MAGMLEEIGTYLVENGIGTPAQDFFVGYMPGSPDSCLAIYAPPGEEPVQGMGPPTDERPRLSIKARSKDYTWADAKAWAAWNLLVAVIGVELSGTEYTIEAMQSPFSLGMDDNERYSIVANFRIMRSLA